MEREKLVLASTMRLSISTWGVIEASFSTRLRALPMLLPMSRPTRVLVRDIGSNIGKAWSLVEKLDSMTPQVLIESRIVEASTSFSRSIGVQWGGFGQAAPASGNATGLNFPSTARM